LILSILRICVPSSPCCTKWKKTIVLFCALVLCTPLARAQVPEATRGIKVTAFFSEEPQDEQLEQEIIAALEQQLGQQGIPRTGTHHTILLLDARWLLQTQEVVLSVTTMQPLPAAVLDVGAAEEVFYLSMARTEPPTDLSAEGQKVRQYVSREWLGQFHMVIGQELLVFPRDALAAEIEELVTNLTGR